MGRQQFRLFLIALIIVCCAFDLSTARRNRKKSHKARPIIIKCCGREKCSREFLRTLPSRNQTANIKSPFRKSRTNIQSSEIGPSPFSPAKQPSSSTPAMTLGVTTEDAEEPAPPVAPSTKEQPPETVISTEPAPLPKETTIVLNQVPVIVTTILETTPAAAPPATQTSTPQATEIQTSAKPSIPDTSSSSLPTSTTCSSPVCPSTCSADLTLFENGGLIQSPEKLGFWANTCGGITYLFNNQIGTWKQNYEKCCSLGMKPIAFETLEEFTCLSNFTKKNWGYNFNYWTGGTQQGCRGNWAWCSGSSPLLPENLTWAFNQPDNKGGNEDCLQMRLLQNQTGLVLFDRNCSDKFVFACEGKPSIKSCGPDKCPFQNFTKDKTRFTGVSLNNYFSYGTWMDSCGRHFLFSKNKTTWMKAQEECIAIGTTLLSVEYGAKHGCLARNVISRKYIIAEIALTFWTSGTDQECDNSYQWCPQGRPFIPSEVNWAPGEPNSANGDCVVVNFSNKTTNLTTFSTAKCEEENYFICEVRKKGTAAQALQNECVETWNITAVDMLIFEEASYNASTIPRDLKCFIKCIGENLEFFSGGAMGPSPKLLRMIEEIAADDDEKLQNSFGTFDKCGSKKHVDECETAAEIYQCGRENEPLMTSTIFSQQAGNATSYSPPVPCVGMNNRQCRYEGLPCVANQTLIDQMALTNKSSKGQYVYYGDKKHFYSYWRDGIDTIRSTALFNFNYCCSLGMKLAEPDLAVFNALPDNYRSASGFYYYIVMQDTYAAGDGTERWCGSDKIIPRVMMAKNYGNPGCINRSCYVKRNMEMIELTAGDCEISSNRSHYFLCSE